MKANTTRSSLTSTGSSREPVADDVPVRVGLVGGGDWARTVHAPMFAAGPETELVGVWSRSASRSAGVAGAHGCRVFDTFDELVEASELVSFAVAPAAQPALACGAASAGRHVLLEKPIAASVTAARELTDALASYRVGSLLLLTYSFSPWLRSFVDGCRVRAPFGARMRFLTTARPTEVTGWRRHRGLLLDLGFHVFDMLDSVLGAIHRITARGDRGRSVDLWLDHATGGRSEATVGWAGLSSRRTELEVLTQDGVLVLDPRACVRDEWFPRAVRAAVGDLVRAGVVTGPDVVRGLYLQRCVEAAERSLECSGPVDVEGFQYVDPGNAG